jgi:uncharacterized protein GlcG (DUF336 family)
MTELTLAKAQTIVTDTLASARGQNLKPMAVVVLDARGELKAAASEDGTSLKRIEIAHGKAFGALSLGLGSRALFQRAQEQPYFIAAVTHAIGGALVPVPGGVLIKACGVVIGAVGASGDHSDKDEMAVVAGIEGAGFSPDTGG